MMEQYRGDLRVGEGSGKGIELPDLGHLTLRKRTQAMNDGTEHHAVGPVIRSFLSSPIVAQGLDVKVHRAGLFE